MKSAREQWSSHWRCLAAATSSSIGLGTLWRVPYTIGAHGGGVFFLAYILSILLVGIPLFTAEVLIGRHTKRSVIPAIRSLEHGKSPWEIVGWIGVIASFLILTYYTVLAGWGLGFLALSLFHPLSGISPGSFDKLVHNGFASVLCHVCFILASVSIVYRGIRKGIERWSLIVTLSLFFLLLCFVAYNYHSPGFHEAVQFLFKPDLSKITASTIIEALGLSLFTLSLGQGIMVTYGSYMEKGENIPRLSLAVGLMVCFAAVLSALTTFPILFSFNLSPQAGIGLVFTTLPHLFSNLFLPGLVSVFFFLLFVLAALGGSLALNEVVVATLMETIGWSRKKAAVAVGSATFLFGLPSSLSYILSETAGWENMLTIVDQAMSSLILPLGGILMILYARNRFPKKIAQAEFCTSPFLRYLFPLWYFAIQFLTPGLMLYVFARNFFSFFLSHR